MAAKLYSLIRIDIKEIADDFEKKVNCFFSVNFIVRHFIGLNDISIYLLTQSLMCLLAFFFISTKGHMLIAVLLN